MAVVRASWLEQGYFVLRNDGLMRDVRDILAKSLGRSSLDIRMFPEEAGKWKHTCWWREGRRPYAEAQFFAQISRGYPILSLGVAVEKGFESQSPTKGRKYMDATWDWHRLVSNTETILDRDVPRIARRLKRPVTLRVRAKNATEEAWALEAFSFREAQWYQRYEGHTDPGRIARELQGIAANRDDWAIVHLGCDFSAKEADGLTAAKIASTLMRFDVVRQRLRASA